MRGGYPSPPGQPSVCQGAGLPVVHSVVTARAKAQQVPVGPCQLRELVRRIRMVYHCGVDCQAVAPTLSALIPVSPQDRLAFDQPAPALVIPGLSPPGKTKNAGANDQTRNGRSWAPAFHAPASYDIQDDFGLTVPAVHRQSRCLRVHGDPQQPVVSMTVGTGKPSILYGKCITLYGLLQCVFLTFFKTCLLFH